MLETLKNAWKIKELRNKILFTILILLIFRIGSVIPVPYINVAALRASMTGEAVNEFFSYLSILTGGGLEYGAIFAMSVTPYINSSIIIQLLCVAIPALERLSKEGEEGQKKFGNHSGYSLLYLLEEKRFLNRKRYNSCNFCRFCYRFGIYRRLCLSNVAWRTG